MGRGTLRDKSERAFWANPKVKFTFVKLDNEITLFFWEMGFNFPDSRARSFYLS